MALPDGATSGSRCHRPRRTQVFAAQSRNWMEHKPTQKKERSERAAHLANLLMLSYEPMLAWKLGGPIEFWNAGAERLYGYTPNEAVGRISHALLQTRFPIELPELISQLRNEGYWSGELRHICRDG